jgi:nitrous oxide reductase
MSDKPHNETLNRRGFLKSAAALGGAAAATALSGTAAAETPGKPMAETRPEAKGYRETPHVLAYYERARF